MELDKQIEAILFFKGEPCEVAELCTLLAITAETVEAALSKLSSDLTGRGIALVTVGSKVELRTSAEASKIIENIRKDELSRDLGKAGSETLAIVLYKGRVTRAEIDYIRGVNSTFILRNLMIRGLVEREQNPTDQRTYVYSPTLELLAFLGVSTREELPKWSEVQNELEQFLEASENRDNGGD
jgi:segregation and condensation protein B